MKSDLVITQTDSALVFQTTRRGQPLQGLFEALASTGAWWMFGHYFLRISHWAVLALSAISGAFAFFRRLQTRQVRTTVTKFEVHVVGNFGQGYRPLRHLPLANFAYLTYHPEILGSGDTPYSPDGIWAVHGSSETCIIPFRTVEESDGTIKRIESRFAHAMGANTPSGFGSNLVSLNLR